MKFLMKIRSVLIILAIFKPSNAGLLEGVVKNVVKLSSKLIDLGVTETDLMSFLNFKIKYEKEYSSEKQEISSLLTFVKNLRLITFQNQKFTRGESKFKDDVNDLSDIEHDWFISTHTGYIATVQARTIHNAERSPMKIPKHLNYADKGLVTRVMYQGYCGACWAFSAIGALEGQLAKKTGRLIKLSEQDLIDCNKDNENGNWGCSGGNMQIAFNYIKKAGGLSPYSLYQYRGEGNFSCKSNRKRSYGAVKGYVEVQSGNETELLLTLVRAGPISLAIDATEPTFQHYKSGIYDHPNCSTSPNHAVLLVGYGTNKKEGPYWILKNSWGTNWGENGFFRLPRNNKNACGIAADPSYPII